MANFFCIWVMQLSQMLTLVQVYPLSRRAAALPSSLYSNSSHLCVCFCLLVLLCEWAQYPHLLQGSFYCSCPASEHHEVQTAARQSLAHCEYS